MYSIKSIIRSPKLMFVSMIFFMAITTCAAASGETAGADSHVSSRLKTVEQYVGVGNFTPSIGNWLLESAPYVRLGYEVRTGKESWLLEALYSEGGYKVDLTVDRYTHTSFQVAYKRKIIGEKYSIGLGLQTHQFGFDNDNKLTVWGPVTMIEYHISNKRRIRLQNAWATRSRMNNQLHAAWSIGLDQDL